MGPVAVIVPAAGRSERMGGKDKLLLPLGGKPLLAWCVDALESSDAVRRIVVAVNPEKMHAYEKLLLERGWSKTCLCAGGSRRQDSVAAALSFIEDSDIVMVHDGDRPFVTSRMIEEGIAVAAKHGAAVAAISVTDTIKEAGPDGVVRRTLKRGDLRAIQTPQVFCREWLLAAYAAMHDDVTDDASLVERLGHSVRLYDGARDNLKVTTPEDLLLARAIVRAKRATS
jgi:2-C-methyl-D-erythritol 4-phosphate cytidylyltransferase